jgi:Lon protease-like protein
MVEDALHGDRLIAMALLRPGWEEVYGSAPAVYPIGCAGRIEDEVRLPDGRFNIRLRGLARVEIVDFIQEHPYRVASVQILEDSHEADGPAVDGDKKRLFAACAGLLQEMSGAEARPMAITSDIPFAAAVNTLCQNLAIEPEMRRTLLELGDVRERCRALIDILSERWKTLAFRQAAQETPEGGVH